MGVIDRRRFCETRDLVPVLLVVGSLSVGFKVMREQTMTEITMGSDPKENLAGGPPPNNNSPVDLGNGVYCIVRLLPPHSLVHKVFGRNSSGYEVFVVHD